MTDRARGRACRTCDVWQESGDGFGTCRAAPPTGSRALPRWPTTSSSDWCGAWRDAAAWDALPEAEAGQLPALGCVHVWHRVAGRRVCARCRVELEP